MPSVMVERTGTERRAMRSAALGGESVPRRVLLTPWGQVESTNGRFIVDEESGRLASEALREHGTDLPIDYEHQTLGGSYAAPNGQAPAAGWIKSIVADPGVGLIAEIEWTAPAIEQLASKQYRYLSPVAVIRREDRKLVAVHSAALTNKPAIAGMPAIVNRADAAAAGDGLREMDGGAVESLREMLALDESADVTEMLMAASERLRAMEAEAERARVEDRIAGAVRAGKLVEAQRAWAEELVRREESLFDEWFRTAPVVVPLGGTRMTVDADGRRQAMVRRARAEFRGSPGVATLTSEEAYVTDALRRAG